MSRLHPVQIIAMEEIELPGDDYYRSVVAARSLVDGRCEIHLRKMLFNLRLAITEGPRSFSYRDEYCFHDETMAWLAFWTWDGTGHPIGFFKHANQARYAGQQAVRPREAR